MDGPVDLSAPAVAKLDVGNASGLLAALDAVKVTFRRSAATRGPAGAKDGPGTYRAASVG